jgi:thioredoxin reductase (NADPH)
MSQAQERDIYDVTIIGGGPVGLFAAFYAGLREMRTKIIEALPELGGQLITLYPDKLIYDVAGFPEILAKDLAANLIAQGLRYRPTVCLEERAVQLEREPDGVYVITTDKGRRHWTRTVIISAGIGAFNPNRLDRPGVQAFEGRGVYYFAKNFEEFRDKRLLIVGGGDSAVDWALHLHPIARHVTLIHRRTEFRAHEKSVRELMAAPVMVKTPYELKELRGDTWVREAVIYQNRTMEVNVRMETSLPGVFACGDIASVEGVGNLKLLATGFGQATIAVGAAKMFIDPTARLFGGHSSEIIPKKEKAGSA